MTVIFAFNDLLRLLPCDWSTALTVAAVVAVVCVAAVGIALFAGVSLPALAASFGSLTTLAKSIIGFALTVGLAGGIYAGVQNATRAATEALRAAQLDIHFTGSDADPQVAKDFACRLVSYKGSRDNARSETINVKGDTIDDFYAQVERELDRWFYWREQSGKADGRKVFIYMDPFPGDGVYERLETLCRQRGDCVVNRVNGNWTCAVKE